MFSELTDEELEDWQTKAWRAVNKAHEDCHHLHVHTDFCLDTSDWAWDLEEEYLTRIGLLAA